MKKLFLFALLFFITQLASAQTGWVWANTGSTVGTAGGPGPSSKSAAVDGNGNLYLTGSLSVSLTVGTITLTTATYHNFYLIKYAPSGAVLWAVTATSSAVNTGGTAIDIDTAGNIVVVGTTMSDTLTFGSLTVTSPQPTSNLMYKSFIVKYSPAGTVLTASILPNNIYLYGVSHDSKGYLYLAGKYDGAPTLGTFTLPNSSLEDVFLAKCSPTGTFLWVTAGGSSAVDELCDLVVNGNGDAFILGSYVNTMTLGNTTVSGSSSSSSTRHMFLSRIDSSGNVLWATSTNAGNPSATISPRHLSKDVHGNLYASGTFVGPAISFNNNVSLSYNYNSAFYGDPNSFFVKYNANGTALWATSVGGQNYGMSTAPDPSGIVYVSGVFLSDTIWLGNTFIGRPSSPGQQDGYIVKYDTSGNFLSAFASSGTLSYLSWGILPDFTGGFYAAGGYSCQSPLSLGNLSLPSNNSGIFVARYGVCTVPPPQPGNITGSSSACLGQQYTYTVPAVPGAISYSWSLPSGWVGSSTTNTITATAGSNGNITVFASNGCGNSLQVSKTLVVNPVPNPTITQSGLLLSTAPGQGTYQWYQNGFPMVGANSNSLLVTTTGAYYVRVANSSNCSDTSNTIVITSVGIEEIKPDKIKIYPQPSKGIFTVEMPELNTDCTIKINNLLGVEVPIRVTSQNGKQRVELQHKQPGIYFLTIQQGARQLSQKIVIE